MSWGAHECGKRQLAKGMHWPGWVSPVLFTLHAFRYLPNPVRIPLPAPVQVSWPALARGPFWKAAWPPILCLLLHSPEGVLWQGWGPLQEAEGTPFGKAADRCFVHGDTGGAPSREPGTGALPWSTLVLAKHLAGKALLLLPQLAPQRMTLRT